MKDYEAYNDLKVPKGSKIILRLDGRNFHSLSKELDLNRPFDLNFIQAMENSAKAIFNEFSPSFVYVFSDEINILLKDIPFSGRIEKLNSVFPSLASSSLTIELIKSFNSSFNSFNPILDKKIPISFDSRIIPVAIHEIPNYFKWRQDEAWRNCVNAYGYWTLRKDLSTKDTVEKLKDLKSSDIHELLFQKGINLNNLPGYEKRGIAIYKFNNNKNKLNIDKELPIFKEEFFKELDII
ncbi:MAG: guanylyltransferase [Methanobrevibacter sp.]|jgi:tRNA(His) 5'-end guanylyltransferase|nr:guanylyltransferase [Methanobrevibacter sp.]